MLSWLHNRKIQEKDGAISLIWGFFRHGPQQGNYRLEGFVVSLASLFGFGVVFGSV